MVHLRLRHLITPKDQEVRLPEAKDDLRLHLANLQIPRRSKLKVEVAANLLVNLPRSRPKDLAAADHLPRWKDNGFHNLATTNLSFQSLWITRGATLTRTPQSFPVSDSWFRSKSPEILVSKGLTPFLNRGWHSSSGFRFCALSSGGTRPTDSSGYLLILLSFCELDYSTSPSKKWTNTNLDAS